MSHEDQFNNNVTNDRDRLELVRILQGHFIIFHRNLLHQGVSYETEHRRVFAYAEIYPKGYPDKVFKLAQPGVTSKYVEPGENDIVLWKEIPIPSGKTEGN